MGRDECTALGRMHDAVRHGGVSTSGARPEGRREGKHDVEVYRYGEAKNPGPQSSEGGGEGEATLTVDDAWRRAKEDPTWIPAWKMWLQQKVVGREGARYRIELQPPTGPGEEGGGGQDGTWGEEELERFLQQCEVEAGWRDHIDEGEGQRLARDWRDWEAEMTMAGIRCPRVEDRGEEALAESGHEEAEAYDVPTTFTQRGGGVGERGAEKGKKGKRRRWRPMEVDQDSGGPRLELGLEDEAVQQAGDGQEAERVTPPEGIRPRRTSEVRPRGRRQRGGPPEAFDVELVTFNGSGAPQALEAMRALGARRKSLGALLLQEHHARGDAVADLQAGAKARGFRLQMNEATAGKGGGASAGVGIAVPTQRGGGGIFGPHVDFSPAESPGRLVGMWLEAAPERGNDRPLHLVLAHGGDDSAEREAGGEGAGGGGCQRLCLGGCRRLQCHPLRAASGGGQDA